MQDQQSNQKIASDHHVQYLDNIQQLTKEMIYDINTGQIDVDNLPAELIQVFKQAGIKKKDLKNPEYAEAIFEAIVLYNKKQAQLRTKPAQKIQQQQNEQKELIFDSEKGQIDVDKLPPDLIHVFKKAGIRKKDLLQKEFAEMIFKAIESYLGEGTMNQQQQQQQEKRSKECFSKSQIIKVSDTNDKRLFELLQGISRTIYHGDGQWSD